MFTGIIQAIGQITSLEPHGEDVRLSIDPGALTLNDVALGDSIAHNGVCLTVIAKEAQRYWVDVSAESLRCTTGLNKTGALLNLEKALRLADRLGGHLVSGHVDGIGQVAQFDWQGDCRELILDIPASLAKFVATKGSLTVNGVSLTTNWANATQCSINLIPHTLQHTTLGNLEAGMPVNVEVDVIARYVERMLQSSNHA